MTVKVSQIDNEERVVVNFLPCKIHANCEAEVDTYFHPEPNNENSLDVSFRGFPLTGIEVKLPEEYCGVVVEADDRDANYRCAGKFDKMTYWNWNKKPTKNDALLAAFDWIDVSAAIHGSADS